MKLRIYIFSAIISALLCFGGTRKALFLGNSYTYVNNLPGLVAQLAEGAGDTLIYDSNTPGGYTLLEHSSNATSISKIEADDWDFVILQDQSQLPTIPFYRENWTYPGGRALDSIIGENCSRPMFFMTWGRRDGGIQCIGGECSADFTDFEHMQDTLEAAYMRIANELEVCCAPVGVAWKNALAIDSTWSFWSGDGSHPSSEGSYLAACVFYAMIFRSSPMSNSFHSSLSSDDAEFLQWIADSTVFVSSAEWIDDSEVPEAAFDYSIHSDSAVFLNGSIGATEYTWNFGDGENSTEENTWHIYPEAGTYIVTLIASDGCLRDYAVDTLEIDPVGVAENTLRKNRIGIYPNPVSEIINLNFHGVTPNRVEIFDLSGRIVKEFKVIDGQTNRNLNLSPGMYFVKSSYSDGSSVTKRIVTIR